MEVHAGKKHKRFDGNLFRVFADFQFSAIILGDEFYGENEYCLQDKKIDEKTVSWVLNVCETNESIGAKIHIGRKSKFVQAEAED